MLEPGFVALLKQELVGLTNDLCLDLQHLTRLSGQLHQAHVARPELGDAALLPVIDLEDVALAHRQVEGQAKLGSLDAGLDQRPTIALEQRRVVAHGGDDGSHELVEGYVARQQ